MVNLIIAVKDRLFGESLCTAMEGTKGVECLSINPLAAEDSLEEEESFSQSPVILLELDPGSLEEEPILTRIKARFPDGKIIILADRYPAGTEVEVLSRGVQGIFQKNGGIDYLKKAVKAVQAGEIWADRQTTGRLINMLSGAKYGGEGWDDSASLLTRREKQILALVAGGLKNTEIGKKLYISERTVKVHLNRIFKKIRVKDRLQAALYAIHHDFIPGKISFPEE
jgi:DNA-binding NarL/FixJ family response regulator